MRIALTGAGGRLGTMLQRELAGRTFVEAVFAWDVPEHDLDDPRSAFRLVQRDRPDVVIHAAAWTDVDGCAREPERAMRRNGAATGEMAEACVDAGARMILISTNEVFDGRRRDGLGYKPDDETNPINPYGASKLAGECAAAAAFAAAPERLGIVRTEWLFGPGAPDFPTKILAAARKADAASQPLKAVNDEWGNPTYTADLARAVVDLIGAGDFGGIHHVVNGLFGSRADWARYVVARAGLAVEVVDVPASTWQRASTPPAWGVLEPTPLPNGPLRPWPDAMAEYAPDLLARSQP